jgi:hypothetical protein
VRERTPAVTTITVKKHLDSDTLRIPELMPLVGKDVEITVRETPGPRRNRKAFFRAAKNPPVDLDALAQLREVSKI